MTKTSWIKRHAVVLVLGLALFYLLFESRAEWSDMHRWNRAVGDLSLVLVALAMALGPLTRLSNLRVFRTWLPYRRELGIHAVIAAAIHTIIILIWWVELDFARLFGFEYHPELERYVMIQQGFGLANLIGIAALLYGIVLATTSNDFSQKRLGTSVWKFVQQGAYVLWWLAVVHTGYFLFMHFLHFHRPTPEPNWAQWPFVGMTVFVVALQIAAIVKTWRRKVLRDGGGAAASASSGG